LNEANKDKKVLITGAGRGIGRAIALAASDAGYEIAAAWHKGKDAADSLASEIAAKGGKVSLVQVDISNRADCEEKFGALACEGPLWGIVLNAGICSDGAFPALTDEAWDSVIRTDLDGFYNTLHPLAMPLCRKKRGRIIAISSVAGIAGNRGQVNYSAAKAGIIGAVKALALELASRSITVNCIAPGLIDTDMARAAPLENIIPHIPMGRIGKPEEVAALAVFLLSEEASYITRQVIAVDGGLA
jgi:3-oxoacyl-[acyl-carrier protein] reductase